MKRNSHTGADHWQTARKPVSKSQLGVLSQEIDDKKCFYRIRARNRVHFVVVDAGVFDEDTECRPYLLIPALPDFPDDSWTRMHVSRSPDGSLHTDIDHDPLPTITTTWHPRRIDVLSLRETERYGANVRGVLWEGRPAVAKIACWPWEISRIANETQAYKTIEKHLQPGEAALAPAFLGHLVENGRVMGLLLEKVEGADFASAGDLAPCADAVRRLHRMGLLHGDVNRYNFLIDRKRKHVQMVDFEHVQGFEERAAREELKRLPAELAEETGRGGPAMEID
ncbi:MAG: hypothetical protein M1831_006926 [Alyxoria varia]|nr:MAG: hypothetical protein M1831_006926 [Alyxoria varia]